VLGRMEREVGRSEVGVGKLEKTDVVLKRRRWREVLRLDLRLGREETGVFDVDLGVLDVEDGGEARGVMSNVSAESSTSESECAWLRGSSSAAPTTESITVRGLFLAEPRRPGLSPLLSPLLLRLPDCPGVRGLLFQDADVNDVKSRSDVTRLGIESDDSVLVGLGKSSPSPSNSTVSVLDFREFDGSLAGG